MGEAPGAVARFEDETFGPSQRRTMEIRGGSSDRGDHGRVRFPVQGRVDRLTKSSWC
ncbi:MAG TPA: hypothetical protein VGB24_23405 [Longimicrobium sp.]|jgi:hypothetical protein|uniref:hypothetical protein n=1 Tax=Longimicrobium sp. TaxID=2029185 RepID=UPI002ED78E4B